MIGGVSLETCWAIKKHWNNKFYDTVASCWLFLWDLVEYFLSICLEPITQIIWYMACHDSCRKPQTYVKPEAAITVFELLMMSGVSLETSWAIKKHWNNKFYYTVTSCWLFLWDLHLTCFDTSWTPSSGSPVIILCGVLCVFNQILKCASEWLCPHITDQFEALIFNWYNNSLMIALKIVPKHVVDCVSIVFTLQCI
jgi:hypothetical protein